MDAPENNCNISQICVCVVWVGVRMNWFNLHVWVQIHFIRLKIIYFDILYVTYIYVYINIFLIYFLYIGQANRQNVCNPQTRKTLMYMFLIT